eukprot:CAMPEP_0174362380 /NCGR_PEP_ID=MMETSP0811_2-20130205/64081_1 /TAXON_ID=73025 ORGANISM="Eutreptiella gymnastica-like, Strain CCMP1594" /NCGR_SAMPLE_ID=MMETSP0811_2 /ASSEMBLY_ACC=CAM_ASM_000667 /LENGTH=115 /DNA_ID=CAMNT_0015499997 /DNA_START=600 /DNA_END=948 /DNA_ORIENTATION=+
MKEHPHPSSNVKGLTSAGRHAPSSLPCGSGPLCLLSADFFERDGLCVTVSWFKAGPFAVPAALLHPRHAAPRVHYPDTLTKRALDWGSSSNLEGNRKGKKMKETAAAVASAAAEG